MSDRPNREPITVRLNPDGVAAVRAMAEQETDGNMSLMIRLLLTEAIQARTSKRNPAVGR